MLSSDDFPPTGFFRLPTVLALIPVGRSTWWAGIRTGRFPPPVHVGRSAMWRVEDIKALIRTVNMGGDPAGSKVPERTQ
jgi:predicted DNA-binding transcriptional regulator AlpA